LTSSQTEIFIISHEPSGDLLGHELAEQLMHMGCNPVMHQSGHAPATCPQSNITPLPPTMGIWDVLGKIRAGKKLVDDLLAYVRQHQPDAVVTIDSMAINGPLARRLRRQHPNCALVHYAAPKLWAWRPGRAKKLRGLFDQLLCLFPFEGKFFDQYQIPTSFVGHPVVGRFEANRPKDGSLLLLPGSRANEIRRLLPIFLQASRDHDPLAERVIVTLARHLELVNGLVGGQPNIRILTSDHDKKRAYEQASLALAASGTVTLELAMANTPMVVAYRVDHLSAMIARRLLLVRYVSLVNLILDKDVVPELLQEQCTTENLSDALSRLKMGDGINQQEEFAKLRLLLREKENPAALAAGQVASAIDHQRLSMGT